jgi:hypothetical protein
MWRNQAIYVFLFLAVKTLALSSYEVQRTPAVAKDSTLLDDSRRSFLTTATATLVSTTAFSQPALSADIKVTPLAHTFITAGGAAAKPIRENDATRFFTNARVVYLLEGSNADPSLASEVLDLTVKRKSGQGSGVASGNVKVLSSSKQLGAIASEMGLDVVVVSKDGENQAEIVEAAKSLAAGDVLLVGPVPSAGTAADGRTLADCASALGSFVGGKIGGGVISVLLDGPREGLKLEEGGYPASELLWYSLPKRS